MNAALQTQTKNSNKPSSPAFVKQLSRGLLAEVNAWEPMLVTEGGSAAPSIVREVLHAPGQPLDPAIRAVLESRFGHDFARVRVHSDSKASDSAKAINARAYTFGQDVVFAAGEYQPQSTGGLRLLAHELTHTIQQQAVPPLEKRSGNRKLQTGVALDHSGARPSAIQRSVQERGVSSPEKVLGRISKVLKKDWWHESIPVKLFKLGKEFDPGKGVDLPSNAFVYTCKGGWIDMGHFFFTAAGASWGLTRGFTWRRAQETEAEQQRDREKFQKMPVSEREKYFGASWEKATQQQKAKRGSAWSAYTIEDLPSDNFGFEFGRSVGDDIYDAMVRFFSRVHAVDASRNQGRLRAMMIETLGSADPEKLPRQHRSMSPVQLVAARELCTAQ